jgi:DoxX-like family
VLVVTPIYLIAGTVLAPQLWLAPLGPFLKIVPLLLATMMALAILDER